MALRCDRVTTGGLSAGARALFRVGGVKGSDFGKPIIAVANSFTEFVPGHVHLNAIGRTVAQSLSHDTLNARRAAMAARANPWQPPEPRKRVISKALRAYAHFAASADKGGIREIQGHGHQGPDHPPLPLPHRHGNA